MDDLVTHDGRIEEVLEAWSVALGRARDAYRGHVYRVFNVARRLAGSAAHDEVLAAASAFHDLGIWSDRTWDYLDPSVARAREQLSARWPEVDEAAVVAAIANHHRLRRVRDGGVVEAFRRADLVDVSRGLFSAGLDRGFHGELVRELPYCGFHRILLRTALAWFVRHPLRPLPMVRL